MTIAEAARRIGVSPSKLYQLVAQRRIAHYRIGGKLVIHEEDVADYLASCRVPAAAAASPEATARRGGTRLKHIALRPAS